MSTCIRPMRPVSHHSAAIEARSTGTNAAAARMKPAYSVPPTV